MENIIAEIKGQIEKTVCNAINKWSDRVSCPIPLRENC